MIKTCEKCGKEFTISSLKNSQGRGRFCSRRCRFEGHRIKINCQECGKEFETVQSRIDAGKDKFCSKFCYSKSTRESKICKFCGKEFEIVKSQRYNNPKVKNPAQFCSKKCYGEYKKGKNHPNYKEKIKCICKQCGKEFEVQPWMIKEGKGIFCSIECNGRYNMTMERNHQWKGGISYEPYCPKFNDEFKERVRIFFGRKCAECGKIEGENGRKLDVHHINYDKLICCNGNIPLFIALCQSHNASANKNRAGWEQHYTDIINTKYNGKCYLTKEEYATLSSQ